jgi:hypothetical protein
VHFLYYSHLQQPKLQCATKFHTALMFLQICEDTACIYDYTLQGKVEVVLLHAGVSQGDTCEELNC